MAGAADAVRALGIACFGPLKEAVKVEGSKTFAKELMLAAAGEVVVRPVAGCCRSSAPGLISAQAGTSAYAAVRPMVLTGAQYRTDIALAAVEGRINVPEDPVHHSQADPG